MPGNANNSNILEAANQIITAINDLRTEIQNVQITINNQSGGGGGCGCCDDDEDLGGSTIQNDGGDEPYYGSEPPAEEDRTGDPPPGFDSWDEYDQNKCNVAAAIVSGLAIWFRRFSQIQDVAFVTSRIVVGLAAGTVLTFPPAIIGIIVGVMVLLYVESQALEGLADDIDANKDDLQCGVYSALSSTAGIDFLRSKLNVFIDNRFPAAVAWAAKKLILFVISIDTMNKAFVDKIGENLPAADCSTCVGAYLIQEYQQDETPVGVLLSGSLDGNSSGFEIQATFGSLGNVNDYHIHIVCPVATAMTIVCTGWSNESAGVSAQYYSPQHNISADTQTGLNSQLDNITGVTSVVIRSSSVFTAEFFILN